MPCFWRHPLCLAPTPLQTWLAARGSLTARLKARYPRFRVEVLRQDWLPAHADEWRLLDLPNPQILVATREVLLMTGEIPLVYAHSITLRKALHGGFQLLGRIGSRPLGESLFSNPRISRSPLAWRRVDPRHPLWQKASAAAGPLPQTLWARRSVFCAGNDHLLVTEVFLPAIESDT